MASIYRAYDQKIRCLFSATNNYNFTFVGFYTPEQIFEEYGISSTNRLTVWNGSEQFNVAPNTAAWAGAHFLSNNTEPLTACFHCEDEATFSGVIQVSKFLSNNKYFELNCSEDAIRKIPYICLSGQIQDKPDVLADWGDKFRLHRFFLPEIKHCVPCVGALALFMSQQMNIRGCRCQFFEQNTEELLYISEQFDSHVAKHDAAGKMAYYVSQGKTILNDICNTPDSTFYGKLISQPQRRIDGVFFVHRTFVEEYFSAPFSVIDYIANYAPVLMKVKDKFKKEFGIDEERVCVRVVNMNDNEHLLAFTRFYELISKKKIFFVQKPLINNLANKVSLFRYNKGYIVPRSFVLENYKG